MKSVLLFLLSSFASLRSLLRSSTRFAVLAVSLCSAVIRASSFSAPPNLIVILADDMGWADLSCYGSEIPTPHLDALAAGGTRLRSFYNCAQCCPTRAALISGMYPHDAGVGDMIDGHSLAIRTAANSPRYSDRLDPRALTIAERTSPSHAPDPVHSPI